MEGARSCSERPLRGVFEVGIEITRGGEVWKVCGAGYLLRWEEAGYWLSWKGEERSWKVVGGWEGTPMRCA